MNLVDFVTKGRTLDECELVLVEPGPWNGGAKDRHARIRTRLYACVDAIFDGQIAREFPETRGKKLVLRLDCRGAPPADIATLFSSVADGVAHTRRYQTAIEECPFAGGLEFELKTDSARRTRASYFSAVPIKTVIAFAHQYERHFSALSMVGGYVFDSYSFGRIDHATTHIVFLAYLAVAGMAIAVSHRLESQPLERRPSERTRTILTAITQFALGCLLSGFCVFYLRSASLWASWPYLLILAGIFIGNEFFKKYTTRFTLSLLLYFFAILSYAILLVPVVIAMIGTIPFIVSSIIALATFIFYSDLLRWLGRARWRQVRLYVYAGVLVITGVINLFYFLKILPPLPLALADAGIYHSVMKVGQVYQVIEEPQPWTTFWGDRPVLHLLPNEKLYLYASVFAPGRLGATIVHHWEWFDPARRRWVPQSRVAFSIRGGRDAGYRAYSIKSKPKAGDWRVNITTGDDRLIGRVRFAVAFEPPAQPLQQKVLN